MTAVVKQKIVFWRGLDEQVDQEALSAVEQLEAKIEGLEIEVMNPVPILENSFIFRQLTRPMAINILALPQLSDMSNRNW